MAKRGNGEGYVYKAKNGSWIAKVQIGWLDNGNPRIKSFSSKTRTNAINRMNEYKALIKHQTDIEAGDCNLYDAMVKWLHDVKRLELKESSYYRLEITINSNIKPYIGNVSIKELNANIIQTQLINVLFEKGLSYSTIKKVYNALNNFLSTY